MKRAYERSCSVLTLPTLMHGRETSTLGTNSKDRRTSPLFIGLYLNTWIQLRLDQVLERCSVCDRAGELSRIDENVYV